MFLSRYNIIYTPVKYYIQYVHLSGDFIISVCWGLVVVTVLVYIIHDERKRTTTYLIRPYWFKTRKTPNGRPLLAIAIAIASCISFCKVPALGYSFNLVRSCTTYLEQFGLRLFPFFPSKKRTNCQNEPNTKPFSFTLHLLLRYI